MSISRDGVVYIKAKKFCELSEINERTLRRYARERKIEFIRNTTNEKSHRYYRLDQVDMFKPIKPLTEEEKNNKIGETLVEEFKDTHYSKN